MVTPVLYGIEIEYENPPPVLKGIEIEFEWPTGGKELAFKAGVKTKMEEAGTKKKEVDN